MKMYPKSIIDKVSSNSNLTIKKLAHSNLNSDEKSKLPEIAISCRTCLNKNDLSSIFENNETERICYEYMMVTGLVLRKNDSLSQKMCEKCMKTFKLCLDFRETCRNAEATQLMLLSKVKIEKDHGIDNISNMNYNPLSVCSDSESMDSTAIPYIKLETDMKTNVPNTAKNLTQPSIIYSTSIIKTEKNCQNQRLKHMNITKKVVKHGTQLKNVLVKCEENESDLYRKLLKSNEKLEIVITPMSKLNGKCESEYAAPIKSKTLCKALKRVTTEKPEQKDHQLIGTVVKGSCDFDEVTTVQHKVMPERPKQRNKRTIQKKRDKSKVCDTYECDLCKKTYIGKRSYHSHLRIHNKYIVCEFCGKRCYNNSVLLRHKRAAHGLEKVHKCSYCDYTGIDNEAVRIHERLHTGERPYICDHCGISFHRRANLVQHIAIHLPDRNFPCPYCKGREKSRKRLQIHIAQTHRLKKYSYKCPRCFKIFSGMKHVRRHLIRIHNEPRAELPPIERIPLNNAMSSISHNTF